MGYTTSFEGRFNLNKEITFSLYKTFERLHRGLESRLKGAPNEQCQWVPTEDGRGIEWDEGDKFYDYVEWLKYIIKEHLKPNGYVLNGEVKWSGEEPDDLGKIVVKNNVVKTRKGKITYD